MTASALPRHWLVREPKTELHPAETLGLAIRNGRNGGNSPLHGTWNSGSSTP